MKTLYLINNLTKRESEAFKNKLKEHKRKTLLELYSVLEKHKTDEKEPDAALLYTTVYKHKYTTAKNYLLRNELRLLNEELYRFIIHAETDKKLEDNTPEHQMMLLKRLVDNNQIDAFNREYKALEDYCHKHSRYDLLFEIQQLRVTKQVPKTNSYIDNLIYSANLLTTGTEHLLNHATIKFMRVRSSIQTINNLSLGRVAPEKQVTLPELPLESKLPKVINEYLLKREKAFTLRGAAKIKVLSDMLAYRKKHEIVRSLEWLLPMEEMFVLFNIGTEYYINNNLKKALEYYDICMELPDLHKNLDSSVVVSNYILVLITQAEYKKAWDLLDKYEELLKHPLVHNRMDIARANIMLLTGQYKKLLAMLPVIFEKFVDSERYYLSMLYLVAYYKTGDTNLFKRELRNLEALFKYKSKAREYSYEPILNFLKQYVSANEEKDKAKRNAMLTKLAEDFENATEFFKIGKLYIWMKNEVAAQLKAK